MQSNSTNHNYSVNLSDAGSTKMHDYKLNKDTFVSLCCTDLAFTESTPRGFSNRGARSSHFVCAAQQQGRVVSVGGVAAYIDYCGRAQLLHAASRRDASLKSPACSSNQNSDISRTLQTLCGHNIRSDEQPRRCLCIMLFI